MNLDLYLERIDDNPPNRFQRERHRVLTMIEIMPRKGERCISIYDKR